MILHNGTGALYQGAFGFNGGNLAFYARKLPRIHPIHTGHLATDLYPLPSDVEWRGGENPLWFEESENHKGLQPMAEKSKRNPKWSRDELILALDFYVYRSYGKTRNFS